MAGASVPKNPFSTKSKVAKRWQIRLGDEDGNAPTAADVTTRLRNPRVVRGNGGLDFIEMEYDLAGQGERLKDFQLKAGFIRRVELWQESENKKDPYRFVAWGEIISQKASVTSGPGGGEKIIVTASLMPYHFGEQLLGPVYRDPTGGFAVVHHAPIVFNPVIDELVENNRSDYFDSDNKFYHWVNPESVRTAPARVIQDNDVPHAWALQNVINTLIWYLNPDETYIKNPSAADIDLWLADAPVVRDLKLPAGKFLNNYLDMILTPFGYGWRIDYEDTAGASPTATIRLYSLNSGQVVQLYQQKPNDPVGAKFTQSNVVDFEIDTEIVSMANWIVLHGGYLEREITVELFRGWLEADDSLTADQLTKDVGTTYESKQRVWRLWVGNEAGDYCNTRTVVAPIGSTALDLTSILGVGTLPRRRKIEDPLTLFEDDAGHGARRRRPPLIEWFNADNEWKPIPNGWGEVLLVDQIGISFNGNEPPAELIARGADARIRITFTVTSDIQMTSTAIRDEESPNGRDCKLFLDVSDRFKNRAVISTGPFASTLNGQPTADTRNDQAAMDTYAENVRSAEDCAIIRGSCRLIGIHLQYKIGQCVDRIKGRNISLNRLATTAATKKYLQITSIAYDLAKQETTVTMEPTQEAPGKGELEY